MIGLRHFERTIVQMTRVAEALGVVNLKEGGKVAVYFAHFQLPLSYVAVITLTQVFLLAGPGRVSAVN